MYFIINSNTNYKWIFTKFKYQNIYHQKNKDKDLVLYNHIEQLLATVIATFAFVISAVVVLTILLFLFDFYMTGTHCLQEGRKHPLLI